MDELILHPVGVRLTELRFGQLSGETVLGLLGGSTAAETAAVTTPTVTPGLLETS